VDQKDVAILPLLSISDKLTIGRKTLTKTEKQLDNEEQFLIAFAAYRDIRLESHGLEQDACISGVEVPHYCLDDRPLYRYKGQEDVNGT
jgi:hypothetical protein